MFINPVTIFLHVHPPWDWLKGGIDSKEELLKLRRETIDMLDLIGLVFGFIGVLVLTFINMPIPVYFVVLGLTILVSFRGIVKFALDE